MVWPCPAEAHGSTGGIKGGVIESSLAFSSKEGGAEWEADKPCQLEGSKTLTSKTRIRCLSANCLVSPLRPGTAMLKVSPHRRHLRNQYRGFLPPCRLSVCPAGCQPRLSLQTCSRSFGFRQVYFSIDWKSTELTVLYIPQSGGIIAPY